MTAIRDVGFIGTGIMGAPMAANLAAVGFAVNAYNRNPARLAPLAERGVTPAATASAAAAGRDAVVVMVSSGAVSREVLFGEGGAARAMRPGALLVVMSSISVPEAEEQAAEAERLGLRWLDAPVSGGERGAIAGTLSIMVGGTEDDFAAAAPLFAALGKAVRIGPKGTGQLAKLVNQLAVASTIVAVSEALMLAEAGGADPARVREALLGGFAGSRILEEHGRRMIERNFVPGGPAKYQIKDTAAAKSLAAGLGLDLPMLDLADRLFCDLVANGGGDLDHSALFLELARRNGRLPDGFPPPA